MDERRELRLGDVITIRHGHAFKGEYFSDTGPGPLLLTPGNFAVGGGFKTGKSKYYLGFVPESYRLKPGDLVVTMTDLSKSGDTLGYPALIPDGIQYLHNQRVGLVHIEKIGLLEQNYLYYALQNSDYRDHILAGATGSTVRHTSPSRIYDYTLSVPNIYEQRTIASLLRALDEKIAGSERTAQTAHLLAEARYNDLTTKATRSLVVGDLLDMKYGKALPAAVRTAGEVAVYGSGGISGTHNEALVTGPGIIVGRKGTVGTVHWSEKKFFPIDTTFWIELHNKELSMEFAFFLLRSLGLSSMNSDSAVPGLNRNNVLALPVRVPADRELRSFRDAVRPIFQLREAVLAESALLATLRDTLLPKLMSGELWVRDAEKVVEAAT